MEGMLIQTYKVPEGQLDLVARRMSFLKDKLKDWCYQTSIQKNMKRLRVYYGDLVPIYHFEDIPSDESVYEEEIETDSDGSSIESEIGGIGTVLNQIGLNQSKHHIIYKVSSGEFSIPMKLTGNVMEMQLIPKEQILEELRKLMFDIHPRIAYNLPDQDFSRVLTLHQDFKRKDLMKERNRPYSITYRIAYALSNTHHSDLFLRKEDIEILEFSRNLQRYEGMPEIAGHEILVAGIPGRENGNMTLGLNFLKNHKPWGRKGLGICKAKPGVCPKEAMETLPVIAGRDFSQKILILNKGIRVAKIIIGGAFGTPWFRDRRKFGKTLLSFRQQVFIDSNSFYKKSEEEIKNLKKALQEIKSLDISEESKLSLENVKRLIQRNFSENPLAWWDRNKIEATLKVKEE
ncbi:UNVERIFIED_CONTAM: movement protein [Sesamum radiatum]|uniref:Movement protein n=1 Tax=Sesamum radiatum TaxID=300843 RepID=A0AAW2L4T7_SESRA